jgi:K+-transporting ATPase A subunit
MNANPWMQLILFLAVLFALAWPLARWCDAVFSGRLAVAGACRVGLDAADRQSRR